MPKGKKREPLAFNTVKRKATQFGKCTGKECKRKQKCTPISQRGELCCHWLAPGVISRRSAAMVNIHAHLAQMYVCMHTYIQRQACMHTYMLTQRPWIASKETGIVG